MNLVPKRLIFDLHLQGNNFACGLMIVLRKARQTLVLDYIFMK